METDCVSRSCQSSSCVPPSLSSDAMTSFSLKATMTSHFVTSRFTWRTPAGRLQKQILYIAFSFLLLFSSVTGNQQFLKQPDDVDVTQGRVVVLNCTIANRGGAVQWMQNAVALGSDRSLPGYPRYSMIGVERQTGSGGQTVGEWSLQITDVRVSDDGEYECQAGATASVEGIRSRAAVLRVVVPPDEPTIDNGPVIPVVMHRPTNVTCRANSGRPAADITWFMDGQRITRGVFPSRHPRPNPKFVDAISMVTLNASKGDSGRQIECRAVNTFMERPYTVFATLDVQYAPEITISVNISRTIREHDFLRFSCSGVANPADMLWRWYRNNEELEETSSVLVIPDIGRDYNDHTIACTASNTVGRSRKEMTLRVEYGPNITNTDRVVGADIARPVVLRCNVDGNPQPHIIWTRRDRDSPNPRPLSTSAVYRIPAVSQAHFGVYVCTASSSGFPDTSRDFFLLQNDKPSIRSEQKQYAAKGEVGLVKCTVRAIPKPDRMVWLRNGQPIDYTTSPRRFSVEETDSLYGRISLLRIFNVQKEDFGLYDCNVVNRYGADNATITLVEKTVPPLPYIIGGVVGGVAVIIIIAFVCVLFQRYRKEDAGSIVGSTTDTDSSGDKKRKDADSPSTLMDQWRQDYNKKDFYNRHSADYDELNYKDHTGNNNAYGCLEPSEPCREPFPGGGDYSRAMTPLERYEAVYGPATYSMTSFRARDQPAMEMTNAKLATDV